MVGFESSEWESKHSREKLLSRSMPQTECRLVSLSDDLATEDLVILLNRYREAYASPKQNL